MEFCGRTPSSVNLFYSRDKRNWEPWDYNELTLENEGDKIWFYNTSGYFSKSSSDWKKFVTTGSLAVGGQINTLISQHGGPLSEWCFYDLFSMSSRDYTDENRQSLKRADQLILPEDIAKYCYNYMFFHCDALVSAPALPSLSTAANCYQYMFGYCGSLTAPPVILAEDFSAEECCAYLFAYSGVTSLATMPNLQVLGDYCFMRMYEGCSGLTRLDNNDFVRANLVNLDMKTYCFYSMFEKCSALEYAVIPNENSLADKCFYMMYSECKSIIETEVLVTDIDNSISAPFYGCYLRCSKLNKVTVHFTTWPDAGAWLRYVNSTGSFYKPGALADTRGYNYIPDNWTIYNEGVYTAQPGN